MNNSNKYIQIIFILALYLLAGCSSLQAFKNGFKSLDHFKPHKEDSRILAEPGAEIFAEKIYSFLPESIEKVESRQYSKFKDKIRIYVFHTEDNFKNYTGAKVSAMAYRGCIFLSPKLFKTPERVKSYLIHELSHLHLYQHIGGYGYLKIPSWFTEGLAALVSDGGGADKVTDDDVRKSLISGNHFFPHDRAGLRDLFVKRYASYWGLQHKHKHHLFYRQCTLFVAFLKEEHPIEFIEFLMEIENGTSFKSAFKEAFETDTVTKWQEFNLMSRGRPKEASGSVSSILVMVTESRRLGNVYGSHSPNYTYDGLKIL